MAAMSDHQIPISQSTAELLDSHLNHFERILSALDAGHSYRSHDPHQMLHEAPVEITVEHQMTVVLTEGEPRITATAVFDDSGRIEDPTLIATWSGGQVESVISPGVSLHRALQAYAEAEVL